MSADHQPLEQNDEMKTSGDEQGTQLQSTEAPEWAHKL